MHNLSFKISRLNGRRPALATHKKKAPAVFAGAFWVV